MTGKSSPIATELRLARQDKTPRDSARNSNGQELGTPVLLPLGRIDSSPLNPRKRFDEEELQSLADSLQTDGLLQPIVVRPVGERFLVVAGERRWRAAKRLEWTHIAAVVRDDVDDAVHLRLALLENLARTDLDPLEEADGYRQLQDLGMTQQAIAAAVHRSQPAIANTIRLLKAPAEVRDRLSTREISPSHVLALLRYEAFPQAMVKIAEIAAEKRTPTKELEKGLGWEFTQGLQDAKLVASIGYNAEFDWQKVCQKKCPFGAFQASNYNGGLCFKPEHFRELQREARAAKKAEVKQALEAASTDGKAALRLNQLKYGQYEQLYQVPRGCSKACDCRRTALSYGDQTVQVCVNPTRYRQLRQEQQQREEQQRKDRAAMLRTHCTKLLDAVTEVGVRELVLLVGAIARNTRWDDLLGKCLKAYAPDAKLSKRVAYDELAALEPVQLVKVAVGVLLSDEIAEIEQWSREEHGFASWYIGERTAKPKRKGKSAAAAAQVDEDTDEAEEIFDEGAPEAELAGVAS